MYLWRPIMYKRVIPILLIFLLSLVSFDASAQCAMCKAVAESNGASGGGVASGLNQGILYMMFFPYFLAAMVGILWYRHNKKTSQADN